MFQLSGFYYTNHQHYNGVLSRGQLKFVGSYLGLCVLLFITTYVNLYLHKPMSLYILDNQSNCSGNRGLLKVYIGL